MKYPVIYKDWGMGEYTRGSSRGPLILIKPEYRNDEGLYQHELVHAKQWWFVTVVCTLLLYSLTFYSTIIEKGVNYPGEINYD